MASSNQSQVHDVPAHEVIATTDVVVKDVDLELVGLVVMHVQVELFQPSWIQRLVLVLCRKNNNTMTTECTRKK